MQFDKEDMQSDEEERQFVLVKLLRFCGSDAHINLFILLNKENIQKLMYMQKLYAKYAKNEEDINSEGFEILDVYSETDAKRCVYCSADSFMNVASFDVQTAVILDGTLNVPSKPKDQPFDEWFEENYDYIKEPTFTKLLKKGKVGSAPQKKRMTFEEYVKKQ
jgi:hypothetical protein